MQNKCFCLPSLVCPSLNLNLSVRGNRRDDIAPSRLVASLPKRFFDKDEYKHHSSAADMAKIWARERRKREHVADKLTSVAFGVRSDLLRFDLGWFGSVSSPFAASPLCKNVRGHDWNSFSYQILERKSGR